MTSNDPERFLGPDRRWRARMPPQVPRVVGRARLLPKHRLHALSIEPGRWYDMVSRPAHILMPTLEGYVWIDLHGHPRTLPARWLEIEAEE